MNSGAGVGKNLLMATHAGYPGIGKIHTTVPYGYQDNGVQDAGTGIDNSGDSLCR